MSREAGKQGHRQGRRWHRAEGPDFHTTIHGTVSPEEPCPCGSGVANAHCHAITHMRRLSQSAADAGLLPQVSTQGVVLASDPDRYSSGVATMCHACSRVLTVGVGLSRATNLVLVCGCGARNEVFPDRERR